MYFYIMIKHYNTLLMNKIINISIIMLTALCVYAICNIGLGWFWTLGSANNYQKINQVLINLSYSYIAGLIFYLLTSYFPDVIKRNRIKEPIRNKIRNINIRFEDCAKCVFPITSWAKIKLTEAALIQQFSTLSSIHTATAYNNIGLNTTVLTHLKSQKDSINNIIDSIIEYKYYLSGQQILILEKIKDSNYNAILNAFNLPILDTPENREKLAKELYKQISLSKQLLTLFHI